jgi:hypothetical protein
MNKDILLHPRWTILTSSDEVNNWMYDDYILLHSTPIFVDDDYVIAEIELKDISIEPTVGNVFNDISCLAIHEEWTNAIITTDECLPIIQELYTWSGSGISLLTSMLTHNERILILNAFFENRKETVEYDKVMLSYNKDDTKLIPLRGNEIHIIDENLAAIKWGDKREAAWWPYFVETAEVINPYLAVVEEEDYIDYPDLDDEGIFYNTRDDLDPYEDFGQEYNWVDQYCHERGYL